MRRGNLNVVFLTAGCLGLGIVLAVSLRASAQTEPLPEGHIYIPPSYGATPASTIINAEAARIAAVGYFLERYARAERHHQMAVEHRIKNLRLWVETYFDIREINHLRRLQRNPNYRMRQAKQLEVKKERITKFFHTVLEGDVTEELNWLLRELSGPTVALQYMPESQELAAFLRQPLDERDLSNLRVTDGQLTLRLDDPEALAFRWPRALRGEKFTPARNDFEQTRKYLREEVEKLDPETPLSHSREKQLIDTVNRLSAILEQDYPRERRKNPADFLEYNRGRRFLQALPAQIYGLVDSNDRWLLDDKYRFKGKDVKDLIRHMYQNGLEFAAPERGDEGTYKKLFTGLREIYVRMTDDSKMPGTQAARPATGGAIPGSGAGN